jgi:DNA-binding response OmpR family regulator
VLEAHGYRVIDAIDGCDAVAKFREYRDEIDLLVFDVVMPRKNGKEAYEEIQKTKKDVPVLFASGYTADIIHEKGILDEGICFISKPVSPDQLLRTIRGILDK